MQNMHNPQQQQQMAMAMNAGMGGPVNGTPVMGNLQRPGQRADTMPPQPKDPFQQLNTYIYDYFIRNNQKELAKAMVDAEIKLNLLRPGKTSPNGRNVNGVDADDLPRAELPPDQLCDNSFLGDWWCQFWDIWSATRNRGSNDQKSAQYAMHTRSLAQMQNEQRSQRMLMGPNITGGMSAQQYQNMMRMQNNVGANNDLKRQAMNNQNRTGQNPMANMNMNKQAMMSAQMQRDGSGMDMNGQRPQSPGSADNAPSPNKRPRVDGPMNTANMGGNFNDFVPQGQNVQQKSLEGMNAGVQGSPMAQQGLDGQHEIFAGNQQRPGMPAGAPGQPQQGNHALQDYQMQLMLLEQQNKKRLLMARQEQDSGNNPHSQATASGQNFASVLSPQAGNRAGPSPNPTDMKRGTPKLNQVGLPGSPMPDAAMQQQRNSPAPNMGFDPSQMPPGMPPQFGVVPGGYPQMPQNPMMRPPSSHPGAFNGQPLSQQQMEAMQAQARMQNGWRGPGGPGGPGPQGPQGMMQGQGQPMGGPMNPQQRNPMPPPPAPPAGEQPRAQEPSPSQPAPAPPTPNQGNKANPKKKPTKNDKPAKAKGANAGATPAASGEDPPPTPTPSTPITPMHAQSFGQNGQPKPGQPQGQPQPPAGPPQNNMDNNSATNFPMEDGLDFTTFELSGDSDLNTFDFDSFLHVGDDPGFSSLGTDFFGAEGVEAGGGDI